MRLLTLSRILWYIPDVSATPTLLPIAFHVFWCNRFRPGGLCHVSSTYSTPGNAHVRKSAFSKFLSITGKYFLLLAQTFFYCDVFLKIYYGHTYSYMYWPFFLVFLKWQCAFTRSSRRLFKLFVQWMDTLFCVYSTRATSTHYLWQTYQHLLAYPCKVLLPLFLLLGFHLVWAITAMHG